MSAHLLPLAAAVWDGDIDRVRTLLHGGAAPNEPHPIDGATALHHAAFARDPAMFSLLTEFGADPHQQSVRSWVAWNDEPWPARCSAIDVLEVLLQRDLRRGALLDPAIAEEWTRIAPLLGRSLPTWRDALERPRALTGAWTAVLIASRGASEGPEFAWEESGPRGLTLEDDGRCSLDHPDAGCVTGLWHPAGSGALLELDDDAHALVAAEPAGRFLEFEYGGHRWMLAAEVRASA